MSTVAFVSAKGSPGVTTSIVGLAAAWANDATPLIVEFDPAGGDLVRRFALGSDLGLVSFAAAARRESVELHDHSQEIPGGVRVVGAPSSCEQATASIALVAQQPNSLRADGVVLVDCGRTDPRSPTWPVIERADLVALVTRPTATDVAHAMALAPHLLERSTTVGLMLAGKGPYSSDEVADVIGVGTLGVLPWDFDGAMLLSGERQSRRAVGRSALLRACRKVAQSIEAVVTGNSRAEVA